MILKRYEVRIVVSGTQTYVVHRRFWTHDAALYYLYRFRTVTHHLEPRIYDRKAERYL